MVRFAIQAWRRVAGAAGVLLLVGLLAGCSPWKVGAERDVVKNGIAFEAFSVQENGSRIGTLAEDTTIDGWPCRKDFVVFRPDWRLDELQLSRDHVRNGVPMPEGSWVFPNADGNPGTCMFPHDVEIQGHLVRGSWMGKEGVMTRFYPSGRLKDFYSRDPVMLDGVPCKDGLIHGIQLHENGRLKGCKLAEAVAIDGEHYSKGALLRFDSDGHVIP